MAERRFNQLYATYAEAVQVVADLTAIGIPTEAISLVESEADARLPHGVSVDSAQHPAGTGATLGAAIGGGIGVLIGVGSITVPFTDALLAAGWFVPFAVFAGIGALLGALLGAVTRLGVTNKRDHMLATGLQKGQHLVMVQVSDVLGPRVQEILNRPHDLPPGTTQPESSWDEEVVVDDRTVAEERAAIRRTEVTIERNSA